MIPDRGRFSIFPTSSEILHSTPSHEHRIRDHSQDAQVWVSYLQVESHVNSPEDVVQVQTVFQTTHFELWETMDLAVQDVVMQHENMVRYVVTGLWEVLQQEKTPIKTPETILGPNDHIENVVQNTQQQLTAQLQ